MDTKARKRSADAAERQREAGRKAAREHRSPGRHNRYYMQGYREETRARIDAIHGNY